MSNMSKKEIPLRRRRLKAKMTRVLLRAKEESQKKPRQAAGKQQKSREQRERETEEQKPNLKTNKSLITIINFILSFIHIHLDLN